jgi:hypothetical protein
MSSNISPEERRRIQEAEALRLEVQKREGFKMLGKMALIIGGIMLFLVLCSVLGFFGVLSSILSGISGA